LRIKHKNRRITLTLLVLSFLTIACTLVGDHFRTLQVEAYERRLEGLQLLDELSAGSDRLTASVRAYSATGQRRYWEAFEDEIQVARTREQAVERLLKLGLSESEQTLLRKAKQNSDALVSLESEAFEAAGQGDLETAIRIVYSDEYRRRKASVTTPIKDCRISLEARLAKEASSLAHRSTFMADLSLLAILINVTAILSALFFFYRRQVVNPLADLNQSLNDLLAQKPDVIISHQDNTSEIGEIARSLESYRQAAETAKAERWIKDHVNDISGSLQTAQTPKEFGERLLSKLMPLLDAGCGAFYRVENSRQKLCLLAGYGIQPPESSESSIGMNEGILGQCLKENKTLVITDLPADYIKIASGTGAAAPKVLLTVPILALDRAMGVLEIALLKPLDDQRATLLDEVAKTIALNLEILNRSLVASVTAQDEQP